MRNSNIFLRYLFFLFLIITSCKTVYQPQTVSYLDYRVTQNNKKDSALLQLLQTYADSVNKSMNDIIAVAEIGLEKKQPEGTLGNILADAMLAKAKDTYNIAVDASFINNGGIRLPSIAAGNITRGKIFELAPFDNTMVLLKINGKILQQFLNHISTRGGWPAAGITWQIKNLPDGKEGKMAINILINGKPINETEMYTIALVDYVANGGDDCIMLRPIPQISNGYLFRDAVIDYFTSINKQGKKISSKIENRVSYAE
jgi:2',3'-cyclic-nucleotide 2'-phosphodiesterase (5'-nucleotidase family)